MKNYFYLFIFLCAYIFSNGSKIVFAHEIKSLCLNEKASSMSIGCPSNKITRILKAFYGYSWSGDCHFIEKDCIVDVPNDDLSCLGEGCSVKIIESPIILQECWSLMASYIQIDYECIPVEELQNMCSIQESERSVGYIISPNYPNLLAADLSCPCTLQAPTGFVISMEVLDFRLPGCSQAGLTLWSDSSTYTHCLTISSGILPGSDSQNISMRLHSQNKKMNAGFLLKYYTNPPNNQIKIKFVCYGSASAWYSKNSTLKIEYIDSTDNEVVSVKPSLIKELNKIKNDKIKNKINNLNYNFSLSTKRIFVKNFNNSFSKENFINEGQELTLLKSKEKSHDWTIIIISVIASVIFLLVLINALIWFIFSIKREDEDTNIQKFVKPNIINNQNYYPQCPEIFKANLQNEDQNDIYSINRAYNNDTGKIYNTKIKIWDKQNPYIIGQHEMFVK